MSSAARAAPRIRDGVRAALPLVPGPVLFGLSFGVFAETAGLSGAAAVLMSATTFAGAAQFAAASVLSTGGTAAAAILAAVLLNARYVGMSIAVASIFPGGRPPRLVESQLIVDESWAVSARPGGRFDARVLVIAGLILYVAWVAGTALGLVTGQALGDPRALGLDGAFPALFLALLVPHLRTRRAVASAVIGGLIAVALLPFTPSGLPIIAAASAALIGLRR